MFGKILIANRGEIACRIIATARRMGIRTVAVYSDADAGAMHVQMADEAVHIGPAPVSESYLSAEKIIGAARRTGAEAIHPGYGFLSENPDFAEAVDTAGLTFIGPPARAIRAMGLKDAAKRLMEDAGVPVVPGYHGENQDADQLAAAAERIGYPVLIKARAGGGGKGMRLVHKPQDFPEALKGAQREALSSFGDPACLIEKYIEKPRHIEIQILGDRHGNIVHLFERDCSLQRRHQKVIEEAPAPGMSGEMRSAMASAALDAARAIGYHGAGTVEFIADASGGLCADRFWFMEMNTRLQVEHPVTEAITGLDLVALQLRIAAGEALPFAQGDLEMTGHAFEARIYAEDAGQGFLPATGRLDYLSFPAASLFEPGSVRIDSGVRRGDEISPYYDPMIAKLIAHGADRAEALRRLSAALAECHIAGLETNVAFLGALARHDGFAKGEVDTDLIARNAENLLSDRSLSDDIHALAALAALGFHLPPETASPSASLRGWRHWGEAEDFCDLEFEDELIRRKIVSLGAEHYRIEGGGEPVDIAFTGGEEAQIHFVSAGIQRKAAVFRGDGAITIFISGQSFTCRLHDPLDGVGEDQASGDTITAPMPGLVKQIGSKAGQEVKKGDALIILEAMKMEHTLKAPRDGRIAALHVAEGDQIAGGLLLITLESEPADG